MSSAKELPGKRKDVLIVTEIKFSIHFLYAKGRGNCASNAYHSAVGMKLVFSLSPSAFKKERVIMSVSIFLLLHSYILSP